MVVALFLGFGASSAQAASPGVVSRGAGSLEVFKRNPYTGELNFASWNYQTGWGPWYSLGGGVHAESDIGVISRGPNHLAVFIRGTDNALYERWWNGGSTWSDWTWLGGTLTGGPSAVAWGGDREDVFVRDTAGGVSQKAWTPGGGWTNWVGLGGGLAPGTGPAVGSRAPGYLDIAVTGTDRRLYIKSYRPDTGWFDWYGVGAWLAGGPGVASIRDNGWNGRQDYVGVASSGAINYYTYENNGFNGWHDLQGVVASNRAPAPIWWRDTPGGPLRFDVFTYGTGDTNVVHERTWQASTGFTPWTSVPNIAPNTINSDGDADAFIARFRQNGEAYAANAYSALNGSDRAWVDARMAATVVDGGLYRVPNTAPVYQFEQGTKAWITSPQAAEQYGMDLATTQFISQGALDRLPSWETNINYEPLAPEDEADAPNGDAELIEGATQSGIYGGTTYQCGGSGTTIRNAGGKLSMGWCYKGATAQVSGRARFANTTWNWYWKAKIGGNVNRCAFLQTSGSLKNGTPGIKQDCGSRGIPANKFALRITKGGTNQDLRTTKACTRYRNVNLTTGGQPGRDEVTSNKVFRDETTKAYDWLPQIPSGKKVQIRYSTRGGDYYMTRYPPSSNKVQRDLNNTDWTFMHKDCFGGAFPANWVNATSAVGGY